MRPTWWYAGRGKGKEREEKRREEKREGERKGEEREWMSGLKGRGSRGELVIHRTHTHLDHPRAFDGDEERTQQRHRQQPVRNEEVHRCNRRVHHVEAHERNVHEHSKTGT